MLVASASAARRPGKGAVRIWRTWNTIRTMSAVRPTARIVMAAQVTEVLSGSR